MRTIDDDQTQTELVIVFGERKKNRAQSSMQKKKKPKNSRRALFCAALFFIDQQYMTSFHMSDAWSDVIRTFIIVSNGDGQRRKFFGNSIDTYRTFQ
jgi:hypothetical protein